MDIEDGESSDHLMFLSREPPVSPSPLPDCEREWLTRVVTWPLSFSELLTYFGPDGLSGKMYRESCHQTKEGTLAPSSGVWSNSGIASRTEYWTLNTSESPSDVVGYSLSRTLETGDIPQRHFLSARACKGLIHRAESHGRELPLNLKEILKRQIQEMDP